MGDLVGRRQLDGGVEELVLGKGGLEEDGTHPQQGGGGPTCVRIIFKGRGTRDDNLWIGDLSCNPRICKALGGFQAQVARRLTGRLLRRALDMKWIYTSAVTAQEEAGFLTTEE